MSAQCNKILKTLKSQYNAKNAAEMAHFGINSKNVLGISMPYLKKFAKKIKKEAKTNKNGAEYRHKLAQELWDSEIFEARSLAVLIDEIKLVDEKQMECWVNDFDSWGICDQTCGYLFDKKEIAWQKAVEWSAQKEEFVKRAGFVLMATLAVHDKKTDDTAFLKFLPIIARESTDARNFVKKAVNWALRQIGKRNAALNKKAIETAKDILKIDSKSSCWIAKDAIKELEKHAVRKFSNDACNNK
ncbi:MAG: DNA alkylation repair protein [Nanoarchaeota archaeon]|nr:DNA alkylation repair protein [Nanoarchaeota archaeon]MBU4300596.1 DNA alkylation repair protein [Nanoarchaeota archaeon]MBU4451742.1 DNA alkylation repair protein [Nanoarchaeota archaeon]MCG2723711.1 DNA alkylation repair protein [archaeon]